MVLMPITELDTAKKTLSIFCCSMPIPHGPEVTLLRLIIMCIAHNETVTYDEQTQYEQLKKEFC